MKTTTTLLDLITAQASIDGYDAFFNPETNQLRENGDSLLTQIAEYTPFIQNVTNKVIFSGFNLSDKSTDNFFKQVFLNRFVNREIKFQTVDLFRSKLVNLMLTNNQWFCDTFKNFDDMFNGVSRSSQNAGQDQSGESRTAMSTLPQDNTELSLDDDNVAYADNTDYNKNKNHQTSHQSNNSFVANPSVVKQLDNVFNKKLDEFDRQLFLQIW